MTLSKYKAKRDLQKTPEPKPIKKKSSGKKSIFVVHDHHASHHHYDLRLEMNKVLKSWAVPKIPPTSKGVKRLAIQVEDHDLDYANFEGTISEGYGAGTVEIWDKGTYELINSEGDPFGKKTPKEIQIKIFGKKLNGKYVLLKTNYGAKPEKSWLFFKVD